jgi:hypothetical protein
MKATRTLNRYFTAICLLALLVMLGIGISVWLSSVAQRNATLRESRFEFSLHAVRGTLESGLRLGLSLSDLAGVQELIEQTRLQEQVILSVDIFDAEGRILFTTATDGVGANLPEAWRAPCLAAVHENWSADDEEGRVLCGALTNNFDQVSGGVVLRYRQKEQSDTFGDLARNWPAVLALLLGLSVLASVAGWLAARNGENKLHLQMEAIAGTAAARNGGQSGPLSDALVVVHGIDDQLDMVEREADRIDMLDLR